MPAIEALATHLEKLVAQLELEWHERRVITNETAVQLQLIREEAERMFAPLPLDA